MFGEGPRQRANPRRAILSRAHVQRVSASLFAVVGLAWSQAAAAQQWIIDGEVAIATGAEGGDAADGKVGWQRARTRLIAGVQLSVDEDPRQAYEVRAFAEFEPRVSVGAELHYIRWLDTRIGVFAGPTAVFAPGTLFGGTVGFKFLFEMGKKTDVLIEPSFSALPLGSDLPDGGIVMWGLVAFGLRTEL